MTWMNFIGFLIQYVFFIFGAAVHESAHAWTAYRFGDPTAKLQNRITLNPAHHIDILGTVIIPFMVYITGAPIIGWARPTPVNPGYFRNPKRDSMFVSAAGPVSNVLFVLVLTAIWHGSNYLLDSNRYVLSILGIGIAINLMLAIFNMVPIPPLDGSGVLEGLLPESLARAYAKMRPYGFLILLGLFYFTGLGGFVWALVRYIGGLLGVLF